MAIQSLLSLSNFAVQSRRTQSRARTFTVEAVLPESTNDSNSISAQYGGQLDAAFKILKTEVHDPEPDSD
jgi:hypothetical protein